MKKKLFTIDHCVQSFSVFAVQIYTKLKYALYLNCKFYDGALYGFTTQLITKKNQLKRSTFHFRCKFIP